MYNSLGKLTIIIFILVISGWIMAFFLANPAQVEASTSNPVKSTIQNKTINTPKLVPSLILSQRELDLGTLTIGQEREMSFSVRNIGGDSINWTILPPDAWFALGLTELSGVSAGNEETVTLRINVIKKDDTLPEESTTINLPVQITLENRGNRLVFVKDLPVGNHRDLIKIETKTGIRKTVFIKFNLIAKEEDIALDVNPPRLDFGLLKKDVPVTKRIRLLNKGEETMRWKTAVVTRNTPEATYMLGRYMGFSHDEIVGKGVYSVPVYLEKRLQLSGSWKEYQGLPVINGKCILKLDFYGRSLALYIKKLNSSGQFNAYIDNTLYKTFVFAETDEDFEFYEIPVADDLLEAQHTLTLALNGTGIVVEGALIGRQDVLEGKPNWISVFPESGFTSKEADYINITLTPTEANPGIYSNTLRLSSNTGDVEVPISFEIASETLPEYIDIYRYFKDNNYLYITAQPTEELRLTSKGFAKQGLAFRLFPSGTLGTIPLHRWYNPNIINQFYSYDYKKGSSMLGYIYEGTVGNIATSRLANTRELYRWYNPKTKQHFFTLSANGEGMGKKGYVFDGIAGYVK
jgi:hypothetical protein